jgi:hypothetical protein
MNSRAYKQGLKWLTMALALSAFGGCTHKEIKQMDPELEIEKNIDLGIILDTTIPLQLSIPIKNRADRTLTIQNISKDCSCTSVKIDKLKLAPGETATLRFVSNLAAKSGLYLSDIVIESDAAERIDEIQIRGRITGQIRVRPSRATILTGDERAPGAFTIFCDDQDGKWNYAGFISTDPNLKIQIKEKETTPTTSVYEGTVDLGQDETRKNYAAYRLAMTTLEFKNDKLGKSFEINLPVEIAVRRKVAIDPPQVAFYGRGAQQRRTILVQSVEAVNVDSVNCASSCITTAIHRVDKNSLMVDFVFLPALMHGESPSELACNLMCRGTVVGSIPINIVDIP